MTITPEQLAKRKANPKAWQEASCEYYKKQALESLESYIINGYETDLGWAIQHAIQAKAHRVEFLKYLDKKVE